MPHKRLCAASGEEVHGVCLIGLMGLCAMITRVRFHPRCTKEARQELGEVRRTRGNESWKTGQKQCLQGAGRGNEDSKVEATRL